MQNFICCIVCAFIRMWKAPKVLLSFILIFTIEKTSQCGTNNIICYNSTTYQMCSGSTRIGLVRTCSDGQICAENITAYACVSQETYNEAITTESILFPPTTTIASTTSEAPTTTTEASTTVTTTESTSSAVTVTTSSDSTPQTVNPPDCNVQPLGRYPAPKCNQFYTCYKFLLIWTDRKLITCESGYAFDTSTSSCVRDGACIP